MNQGNYWIDYELGHIWSHFYWGFHWDPVTGIETRRQWRCIGKSPIKSPYYQITDPRTGKRELLHRYLFSMYHSIPLWGFSEIDHIDRNKKNNSISNLRIATHSENMRNTDRYDAYLERSLPDLR